MPCPMTNRRLRCLGWTSAVLALVAAVAIMVASEITSLQATSPTSIGSVRFATSQQQQQQASVIGVSFESLRFAFAPRFGSTVTLCDCAFSVLMGSVPELPTIQLRLGGATDRCATLTAGNPTLRASGAVPILPLLRWIFPPIEGEASEPESARLECSVSASLFGGPLSLPSSVSLMMDVDPQVIRGSIASYIPLLQRASSGASAPVSLLESLLHGAFDSLVHTTTTPDGGRGLQSGTHFDVRSTVDFAIPALTFPLTVAGIRVDAVGIDFAGAALLLSGGPGDASTAALLSSTSAAGACNASAFDAATGPCLATLAALHLAPLSFELPLNSATSSAPAPAPAVIVSLGLSSSRISSRFLSARVGISLAAHSILQHLPAALQEALSSDATLAGILGLDGDAAAALAHDLVYAMRVSELSAADVPGVGAALRPPSISAVAAATPVAWSLEDMDAAVVAAQTGGLSVPAADPLSPLSAITRWLLGGRTAAATAPSPAPQSTVPTVQSTLPPSVPSSLLLPSRLSVAWEGELHLHADADSTPSSSTESTPANADDSATSSSSPPSTDSPSNGGTRRQRRASSAQSGPPTFEFTLWSPVFIINGATLTASAEVSLSAAPTASFLEVYLNQQLQGSLGSAFSYSPAVTTEIAPLWRDCVNVGQPWFNYNTYDVAPAATSAVRRKTECGTLVGSVHPVQSIINAAASATTAALPPTVVVSATIDLGGLSSCGAHVLREYDLSPFPLQPEPASCVIQEPTAAPVYPGGALVLELPSLGAVSLPLSLSSSRVWLLAPPGMPSFPPGEFTLNPTVDAPSLWPPYAIDPSSLDAAPPVVTLPRSVVFVPESGRPVYGVRGPQGITLGGPTYSGGGNFNADASASTANAAAAIAAALLTRSSPYARMGVQALVLAGGSCPSGIPPFPLESVPCAPIIIYGSNRSAVYLRYDLYRSSADIWQPNMGTIGAIIPVSNVDGYGGGSFYAGVSCSILAVSFTIPVPAIITSNARVSADCWSNGMSPGCVLAMGRNLIGAAFNALVQGSMNAAKIQGWLDAAVAEPILGDIQKKINSLIPDGWFLKGFVYSAATTTTIAVGHALTWVASAARAVKLSSIAADARLYVGPTALSVVPHAALYFNFSSGSDHTVISDAVAYLSRDDDASPGGGLQWFHVLCALQPQDRTVASPFGLKTQLVGGVDVTLTNTAGVSISMPFHVNLGQIIDAGDNYIVPLLETFTSGVPVYSNTYGSSTVYVAAVNPVIPAPGIFASGVSLREIIQAVAPRYPLSDSLRFGVNYLSAVINNDDPQYPSMYIPDCIPIIPVTSISVSPSTAPAAVAMAAAVPSPSSTPVAAQAGPPQSAAAAAAADPPPWVMIAVVGCSVYGCFALVFLLISWGRSSGGSCSSDDKITPTSHSASAIKSTEVDAETAAAAGASPPLVIAVVNPFFGSHRQ